jgi:mannose-6-phosphate isomerase-like protein (cupin superfamily)
LSKHTIFNLREAEDLAAKHGFGDHQEARFAYSDLDAESTGVALLKVKPGQRQPFAHRHEKAEEIYVVLSGSGKIRLDDEVHDVGEMDAIRIAPWVVRSMAAGPEGLEVLVFGPRHEGDAETIQDEFDDWGD